MKNYFILFLSLAALLSGCQRHAEAELDGLSSMLKTELNWLKTERTGQAAVVFEEPKSGKFVQFSGNELFFDLPHQPLSDDEMERADLVMGHLGVPKESYPLGQGPDLYIQTAFQKDLDGDIDEALRIADTVFREVYRFSEDATIQAIRIR